MIIFTCIMSVWSARMYVYICVSEYSYVSEAHGVQMGAPECLELE